MPTAPGGSTSRRILSTHLIEEVTGLFERVLRKEPVVELAAA